MTYSWFKHYDGMVDDGKWDYAAELAGAPMSLVSISFAKVCEYASKRSDRGSVAGFDPRMISARFKEFTLEQVERVLAVFRQIGVIVNERIAAWARRQGGNAVPARGAGAGSHPGSDPELRRRVSELADAGMGVRAVAGELGISKSTAHRLSRVAQQGVPEAAPVPAVPAATAVPAVPAGTQSVPAGTAECPTGCPTTSAEPKKTSENQVVGTVSQAVSQTPVPAQEEEIEIEIENPFLLPSVPLPRAEITQDPAVARADARALPASGSGFDVTKVKHDRWLNNLLMGEASRRLAADEWAALADACTQTPMPAWAKRTLERLDKLAKRDKAARGGSAGRASRRAAA